MSPVDCNDAVCVDARQSPLVMPLAHHLEADQESIASDHSEMADVVSAHLTAAVPTGGAAERAPDETEAAYRKRLRKQNYLSLAQEFAELQRTTAGKVDNALSTTATTAAASKMDDFDVYNIETTLPQMDWDHIEERLRAASEEDKERKSRHNDREEIRRRLALAGADEDYYAGERSFRKPSLQTRLQDRMNLQICFVNSVADDDDEDGDGGDKGDVTRVTNGDAIAAVTLSDTKDLSLSSKFMMDSQSDPAVGAIDDDGDFFAKQAKLQAEATMALAQVRPMAHMQLEIEKQMRKKSPIAEIVGIPGFGDGKRLKLRHPRMFEMNIAQLQVVVNDLHTQIENLNEELVQLLVERDDLHMEQDSMLVDIEDLTRRAQELSVKSDTKKTDVEKQEVAADGDVEPHGKRSQKKLDKQKWYK